MRSVRQDLTSAANIARRQFWERCAARPPHIQSDDAGDFLWQETPRQIAEWADAMLAEWEARWVAEELNEGATRRLEEAGT